MIAVGSQAPDFTLKDQNGKEVTLKSEAPRRKGRGFPVRQFRFILCPLPPPFRVGARGTIRSIKSGIFLLAGSTLCYYVIKGVFYLKTINRMEEVISE